MKFLLTKYRLISIWLSLFILAMAFVIGSDAGIRAVCIPFTFGAGTLLYAAGAVREWMLGWMTACLIEILFAICMLTGTFLSLLRLGGII